MQENLSNSWTYHSLPVVVVDVVIGVVVIAVVVVVAPSESEFKQLRPCKRRKTENTCENLNQIYKWLCRRA